MPHYVIRRTTSAHYLRRLPSEELVWTDDPAAALTFEFMTIAMGFALHHLDLSIQDYEVEVR